MSASAIKQRQAAWAKAAGLSPSRSGYCRSPELNLPWLSTNIRQDFIDADGDEFGVSRGFAKIAALHSSSALAVNFFGYWSGRDCTPLVAALGLPSAIRELRFEQKFATGVGPRSPTLDVVLLLNDGSIRAIESKFCEPFTPHAPRVIQSKYFSGPSPRWTAVGLRGAQNAAESLRNGNPYKHLDAPQLLKHMLGLGNQPKPWLLQLLWYRPKTDADGRLDAEITQFQLALGEDASRFEAQTYQRVWNSLAGTLDRDHEDYRRYMHARYFMDGPQPQHASALECRRPDRGGVESY